MASSEEEVQELSLPSSNCLLISAALEARGGHGLLRVHRRRSRPPAFGLLRGRFRRKSRREPEIEIGGVPHQLRRRLVGALPLRRHPGPRSRESRARIRIPELPDVRTGDLGLGVLVGSRRGSRRSRPSSAAAQEFRHRPQGPAPQYGLDRRLAHVPVPSPEQSHGSVHRVHGSSTRFKQQRLKQRWKKARITEISVQLTPPKKKSYIYIYIYLYIPGLWDSGTAEMKDIRPARPKNLATKTVAWPWASAVSIHCKQGLKIHDSLQPFRRTRHPLQLIFLYLNLSLFYIYIDLCIPIYLL
ncbi:LOW QUALITY PROTEIN: hypothetical protein TorRG33x02_033680 [Trema orientale]|uniref:Uncharacterized protein n=1 Tax=Trema orientale TaxID=63057 RepID=A0A2P5FSG9_TREOI|nr:LOW QUALITY PROTEIN: hypothetical protein TorRG33x02_033680 [Trema orientale]